MATIASRFNQALQGVSAGQTTAAAPLNDRVGIGLMTQLEASGRLDTIMANATLAGTSLWSSPSNTQITALSWWFVLMHWQFASQVLEGARGLVRNQAHIPMVPYRIANFFCQSAEDWAVQAIRNETANESTPLSPVQLQELPDFPVTAETCVGIWGLLEVIYNQVQSDLARIVNATPSRFDDLLKSLVRDVDASIRLFDHFQHSWLGATTSELRINLVTRALEPARALYQLSQKLWAPYLLGNTYQKSLTRPPALTELNLPFSPWILTDRKEQRARVNDQQSIAELTSFWNAVVNRSQVQQIQQELAAALRAKRIRNSERSYFGAPWPTRYLVRYPVTIGGRNFVPGDYLAVFVNNEHGKITVEVRRSGRATTIAEMLGLKKD